MRTSHAQTDDSGTIAQGGPQAARDSDGVQGQDVLTDFERSDIEQFVRKWTLAFAYTVKGHTDVARQGAETECASLLSSIFGLPSVERLASNPLLLTILALIKHYGVDLPTERVRLYELYLETLIESWNRIRALDQYAAAGFDIFERYLLNPAWHETLLLAIGFIGVIRRNRKLAGSVMQKILQMELPAEALDRQVVFVGEALLEMGKNNANRLVAREIADALIQVMQSTVTPPQTRSDAGYVLGRLGDPREGVAMLPPLLTDPLRIEIESWAGKRIKSFRAGVYPVTNAQFAQFMEAGGYDESEWWSEDGWLWRRSRPRYSVQKLDQPDYWENSRFNNPNQPVVGVTWYEARAFCRWLSATREGTHRLPTEKEWESCARGKEEYEYPWGSESMSLS